MPLADATQTGAPKGGPADRSARNEPGSVRVVAPARLHLGFLDLNGGLGRVFGSIGLAIDTPRTELVLKRARAFKGEGPDHARALGALRRFAEVFALEGGYEVKVTSAIPRPRRARLGDATCTRRRCRLDGTRGGSPIAPHGSARSSTGAPARPSAWPPSSTAALSSTAVAGAVDRAPPILVRTHFPEAWRALLVMDANTAGVHGEAEAKAFAALPPLPDTAAARVCRLVLMQLVPGLMESDIDAFGERADRDSGDRRRPLRSRTRRQPLDQPGRRARRRSAARVRRLRNWTELVGARRGSRSLTPRKLPTASMILQSNSLEPRVLRYWSLPGATGVPASSGSRAHSQKNRGKQKNERRHSDSAHALAAKAYVPVRREHGSGCRLEGHRPLHQRDARGGHCADAGRHLLASAELRSAHGPVHRRQGRHSGPRHDGRRREGAGAAVRPVDLRRPGRLVHHRGGHGRLRRARAAHQIQ